MASGGHSSSRCAGLSLSRPLLLRSTDSSRAGSVVVAHGPSCSAACGILPDQGSNPCPLHWQADSQPLGHQGSPKLLPSIFFLSLTQVCKEKSFDFFSDKLVADSWSQIFLAGGEHELSMLNVLVPCYTAAGYVWWGRTSSCPLSPNGLFRTWVPLQHLFRGASGSGHLGHGSLWSCFPSGVTCSRPPGSRL